MEQQTPIPPPLKSRMKPREGQKSAIFPSLIWGEGGGGSRFSIYFVQDCSSMQVRVRSLPVPLRYKVFPAWDLSLVNMPFIISSFAWITSSQTISICFSRLILTDILLFINSRFCLENAGEEEKRQFLQEIDLMKDVGSHRNILSMLGFWIRSEPIMLIMEYVPHGDLLKWLRNKRQQIKLVTVCIDCLPFAH